MLVTAISLVSNKKLENVNPIASFSDDTIPQIVCRGFSPKQKFCWNVDDFRLVTPAHSTKNKRIFKRKSISQISLTNEQILKIQKKGTGFCIKYQNILPGISAALTEQHTCTTHGGKKKIGQNNWQKLWITKRVPQQPTARTQLTVSDQVSVELEAM